ncbi:hypothetical protein KOW79_013495 [Hemibagrus wyckioides]|uniref:Uncharacterized protein n=1 Tax=Hemibagrus wyckioides TaxID=337641 RepID=A0A9D3SLF8_9TELE|nr:hypothetical protein KOW79_013495 [Hemibagrus wyckioides]
MCFESLYVRTPLAGKMDKQKDLSDFDKGQIVMALQLGQSVSETADLVGCPEAAVQEIMEETDKKKGRSKQKSRTRPQKNPPV